MPDSYDGENRLRAHSAHLKQGPRQSFRNGISKSGITSRIEVHGRRLDSAAAGLLFGIAIFAIDRTITAWLERNFAFLFAF